VPTGGANNQTRTAEKRGKQKFGSVGLSGGFFFPGVIRGNLFIYLLTYFFIYLFMYLLFYLFI